MVSFASSWNNGRLDYAANCAGICENVWGEVKSLSTELFDKTFAINARGLWLCQKYEAQQMQKQEPREPKFTPSAPRPIPGQRGAIVKIASISGLHANGLAAYTASKYAAVGITKNGARFYGPDGIRCNAICPGWTLTAMIERSMGSEGTIGTQENRDSEVSRKIALRRMAFAEEQANVLSFLLSDESSYLNGSLIVSDQGFTTPASLPERVASNTRTPRSDTSLRGPCWWDKYLRNFRGRQSWTINRDGNFWDIDAEDFKPER